MYSGGESIEADTFTIGNIQEWLKKLGLVKRQRWNLYQLEMYSLIGRKGGGKILKPKISIIGNVRGWPKNSGGKALKAHLIPILFSYFGGEVQKGCSLYFVLDFILKPLLILFSLFNTWRLENQGTIAQ